MSLMLRLKFIGVITTLFVSWNCNKAIIVTVNNLLGVWELEPVNTLAGSMGIRTTKYACWEYGN